MRILFLYITLACLPNLIYGQWQNMPKGTKFFYAYNYYVIDNSRHNDTIFKSSVLHSFQIDTIIRLSEKRRYIVAFSTIVEPRGNYLFQRGKKGMKLEEETPVDAVYDKDNCSLYYFTDDTICGITMPRIFKNELRDTKKVRLLDDSLKTILLKQYDPILESDGQFSIGKNKFFMQPFRVQKGENSKRPDKYFHQYDDPFEGVYIAYNGGSKDSYIAPSRKADAKMTLSEINGIENTYTAYYDKYTFVYTMKLKEIVSPK